jgi:hypothetical protein
MDYISLLVLPSESDTQKLSTTHSCRMEGGKRTGCLCGVGLGGG